jgi:hypothetical protein
MRVCVLGVCARAFVGPLGQAPQAVGHHGATMLGRTSARSAITCVGIGTRRHRQR